MSGDEDPPRNQRRVSSGGVQGDRFRAYDDGLLPKDGHRGPATADDVLAFQRQWNLCHPDDQIAEDGILGPHTAERYAHVYPGALLSRETYKP